MNIYPAIGAVMFALVVVMTMFSAMTFDPRLLWDREPIQAMRKYNNMENKSGEAKVQKVKNWSPVWIFPIVTALIGAWILFYHYSHQGPEVTLITTNAEGIEGEKPGSRAAA